MLVLYSGGRTVTVTGSNFLSIQQPEFHLSDKSHRYSSYVSAASGLKCDDYHSLTVIKIFLMFTSYKLQVQKRRSSKTSFWSCGMLQNCVQCRQIRI